jgi:hypothetical protein
VFAPEASSGVMPWTLQQSISLLTLSCSSWLNFDCHRHRPLIYCSAWVNLSLQTSVLWVRSNLRFEPTKKFYTSQMYSETSYVIPSYRHTVIPSYRHTVIPNHSAYQRTPVPYKCSGASALVHVFLYTLLLATGSIHLYNVNHKLFSCRGFANLPEVECDSNFSRHHNSLHDY